MAVLFGNLWRFRSVICGIKKRNIYWLTQIDKKTRVRFNQQHKQLYFNNICACNNIARAQEEEQKNSYKKTTKTILRLKAKTT